MPSPDASPYIDLTIYDRDPQTIFENAQLDLATNLPEWIPREGNIETLLLESLALIVSESVFSINRLPSALVEVLLQLFGITRNIGNPPQATLTFNVAVSTGVTIPAGTSCVLTLPGGVLPITFTTDIELEIASSFTTGTVTATGDRFTDEANNIANGTALALQDAVTYVDTVTWDGIVTPGAFPEADTDYFTRALQRFGRLSDTLVLPKHFVAFALENPIFVRAFAIDNWDANPADTPGTVGGHITLAVYGEGRLNTSDEKSDLVTAMQAITLANLVVHVIDPTITAVNVTATIQALPGFDAAVVSAAVTAALNAYLSPMTWGWGSTVRVYELIALINNIAGVDYVVSMTTPSSDVSLTGAAPLVEPGTYSLTVNAA